jgi:hypothetical protein
MKISQATLLIGMCRLAVTETPTIKRREPGIERQPDPRGNPKVPMAILTLTQSFPHETRLKTARISSPFPIVSQTR